MMLNVDFEATGWILPSPIKDWALSLVQGSAELTLSEWMNFCMYILYIFGWLAVLHCVVVTTHSYRFYAWQQLRTCLRWCSFWFRVMSRLLQLAPGRCACMCYPTSATHPECSSLNCHGQFFHTLHCLPVATKMVEQAPCWHQANSCTNSIPVWKQTFVKILSHPDHQIYLTCSDAPWPVLKRKINLLKQFSIFDEGDVLSWLLQWLNAHIVNHCKNVMITSHATDVENLLAMKNGSVLPQMWHTYEKKGHCSKMWNQLKKSMY